MMRKLLLGGFAAAVAAAARGGAETAPEAPAETAPPAPPLTFGDLTVDQKLAHLHGVAMQALQLVANLTQHPMIAAMRTPGDVENFRMFVRGLTVNASDYNETELAGIAGPHVFVADPAAKVSGWHPVGAMTPPATEAAEMAETE